MFKRASILLVYLAHLAPAALLRIETLERSEVLAGKPFGPTGPYERIIARAYFGVDPNLPANKVISDIALAPRNKQGLVEFSSDLYVLRPLDPARANGAVLYEVSNRGQKGLLALYNRASPSLDPRGEAEFGDGFLMEQGYLLVWLGWQFDVPRVEKRMRLYAPAVKGVTGPVRAEFILDAAETEQSLADREHIVYPVVNPEDSKLTLTVRERNDGARRTLPRSRWEIRDRRRLVIPAGFEPGKIYELVYTSTDPPVAGLGLAAIRDFLAFLKYGGPATVLNDQSRYIKRAYGYGSSQSGRLLRTFLYHGFNRDEKNRKVFDGLLAHGAGAGRGSFNQRFAQPSRDGSPFLNLFYPTDIFPFTDVEQTDPETGLNDGLLSHNLPPEATPKIFYTNSSYEYYGRAASLIHTTLDGKKDAPIPPTTRIYMFAGGQHGGPSAFPPTRSRAQNLTNPNPYPYAQRALLVAMNKWVREGRDPPPSQYPLVSEDKAVSLGAVRFPKIPGVIFPTRIQKAYRMDYGPEFQAAGIATIEPPKVGKAFPMLVPQVDRDGNDIAGVRMPAIEVPLATYTGWNLRSPEIGAPDEMFSLTGSYFPFPRDKADREKNNDPRLSIAERYPTRAEYLRRVAAAANSLVDRGFLLERDVEKMVGYSAGEWDYLAAPSN